MITKNKYQEAASVIKERLVVLQATLGEEYRKNTPPPGSNDHVAYDEGVEAAFTRAIETLKGIAEGSITVGQRSLFDDMQKIKLQCEGFSYFPEGSSTAQQRETNPSFLSYAKRLVGQVLSSGLASEELLLVGGSVRPGMTKASH